MKKNTHRPARISPSRRAGLRIGRSTMADEKRKRILSGIQPTGTPTLGNYIGAVRNWALLQ